jgi:hypothetical protein
MADFSWPYSSFIRGRQTPVSMRRGAGLASAEFTSLSRLGPAGGATNRESLVLLGFHSRIMHCRKGIRWSILTSLHIHFR